MTKQVYIFGSILTFRFSDYFMRRMPAMIVTVSLSVLSIFCSNTLFADNSYDISDIRKLYSDINREIANGHFNKFYIFTVFPSDERLVQELYTDDVKYSPDVTIVHHRKGYIAKIERKGTDGDIEAVNEYYFRQNGLLFFQYGKHDELTGPHKKVPILYENRSYINVKGRLIRFMQAAYYIKNGKKGDLVYSDNLMDTNLDPKEKAVLSGIREFEFYKDIEKHLNKK